MAKTNINMVHCRYPKCSKLHETTELKREDAIEGGSKGTYYHPDCYHIMQTVNQIKNIYYHEVNPTSTGKQIGQLVSITNNMVFDKKIDVDLILFAVKYFVKYKPGKLRYPGGIAYIIQDKDVVSAWEKEKRQKLKEEIKAAVNQSDKDLQSVEDFSFLTEPVEDNKSTYKPSNKSRFSNVLGV